MKKNKNSLKNLKQFKKFRTRAKFQFYVVFRPRAQKLFFPIVFLIFSIACANHWYDNRGVWNFENATIQVGNKAQDQTHERSEEAQMEDGTNRGKNSVSVAEVVGGTQVSSVNGSAIEVIQKVAKREGIDWKILAAICIKESNCNTNRVGDSGKSLGAFQIHTGYHPEISKEKATNLEWSAEWTAKRLKRYAYLGESEMVRSHNGLVPNNANAYYVNDVYEIIKNL